MIVIKLLNKNLNHSAASDNMLLAPYPYKNQEIIYYRLTNVTDIKAGKKKAIMIELLL